MEELLKLIREKREEIKQLEDETPSEHYYRDGYSDALDYIENIVSRVELPVKPEIANGWISVKDRLPSNEETIIVYIPEMDRPEHRPIQFARYVKSIDRFFIEGTPTEWFINYWQPLMNKPE